MIGVRTLARSDFVSAIVFVAWAVAAMIHQHWWAFVIATVIWLVAHQGSGLFAIAGVTVALYQHDVVLLIAFALLVVTRAATQLVPLWLVRKPVDRDRLTAAISQVDPRDVAAIVTRLGPGPISTQSFGVMAIVERPEPWRRDITPDPRSWDGPLLRDRAGNTWTMYAAEAVILAGRLAAVAEPMSPWQARAAAGLVLPETALADLVEHGTDSFAIAQKITGVTADDLVTEIQAFLSDPAGGDVVRRTTMRLAIDEHRALPRAMVCTLSSRRATLMALAVAVGGRLGLLTAPGLAASLIRRTPKPSPGSGAVATRATPPSRPAPPTSATPPATTSPQPAPPRTAPASKAPSRRERRPSRLARIGAYVRLSADRSGWPATLSLRVARPVITITASVVGALTPGPWWLRTLLGIAPLAVRPLRHWWLDALFAYAVFAAGGAVPYAVALLSRALATGLPIVWKGAEATVRAPRREFISTMTGHERDRIPALDDAWEAYRRGLEAGNDFDEGGLDYVVAAWPTGDALILGRALVRVLRIELLGWQPVPGLNPRTASGVFRLVVIESLTDRAVRAAAMLAVTATAWWAAPARAVTIGPISLSYAWIAAAAGAQLAVLATRRKIGKLGLGLLAVLGIVWLGTRALPPLAVAVLAAGAVGAARLALTRRFVVVPPRLSWVGRRVTGRRNHPVYRAGAHLAAHGRPGVAAQMMADMAGAVHDRRPAAATAALAQGALIELDRGNLQRAVECTDALPDLDARHRSRVARGLGAYATGMVRFQVGDYQGATEQLTRAEPALRRRPEGTTCASILAQTYAAIGDWDRAAEAASRAGRRTMTPGQFRALIDAHVAAAWALLRSGRPERAIGYINDVNGLTDTDDLPDGIEPDERNRDIQRRQVGETWLILGRAHLAVGAVDEATDALDRALRLLRRTTAVDLHGMTRIYLGQSARLEGDWVTAREQVRAGIEILESRRGRLRTGTNRASAVAAGSDHYDTALDVLVAAQRHGDAEAGVIAAALIESLRRNALSATLREDQALFLDTLPEAARGILERITRVEFSAEETGADDLHRLRRELEEEMSRGFAEAYLPAAVDYTELSLAARGGHILQFEIRETGANRWRGYRVWVPPDGTPLVEEVVVSDPTALAILTAVRHTGETDALYAAFEDVAAAWASLAHALLPAAMIAALCGRPDADPPRLVVVPGEHLAYLPWAPLLLDPTDLEAVLVRKAIIQIVPSLGLLRPAARPSTGGGLLAYLDAEAAEMVERGGRPAEFWRRLRTALPTTPVSSREEFEDRLADPRVDGIYLVAHGAGTGLGQGIQFSRGGVLSAAAALKFRWPRSLVFASCFVAKIEQPAGREPFGLIVACMLGGCRTVIGGVIEVVRLATGDITAAAAEAIAHGVEPATALRAAQIDYLDRNGGATAFTNEWAGLVCVSTYSVQDRTHCPSDAASRRSATTST